MPRTRPWSGPTGSWSTPDAAGCRTPAAWWAARRPAGAERAARTRSLAAPFAGGELAGRRDAEFDAVGRQLHERLFQRPELRGELVQHDGGGGRELADPRRGEPGDPQLVRPVLPRLARDCLAAFGGDQVGKPGRVGAAHQHRLFRAALDELLSATRRDQPDRKSTRLNSSHVEISYAVFCLKKKNRTSLFLNYIIINHYIHYT